MKRINPDQRIIFIILGILLLSQLVYLYINVRTFQTRYLQAVRSNLHTVGTSLQVDLEDLLRKGIPIRKFFGLEPLFKEVIAETEELSFIGIRDSAGSLLYFCDRRLFYQHDASSGNQPKLFTGKKAAEYQLPLPLTGRGGNRQGKLILGIDQEKIHRHVREIALDTGTMVLISILAVLDFLFFVIAWTITIPIQRAAKEMQTASANISRRAFIPPTGIVFADMLIRQFTHIHDRFRRKWQQVGTLSEPLLSSFQKARQCNGKITHPAESLRSIIRRFDTGQSEATNQITVQSSALIRPALFLFVFSEALSISFLPVFAKNLYQPIAWLSQDMALGLPISSFMLMTALSLPIGGMLTEKIGYLKSFLAGACISALGLIFTGQAQTIWSLMGYRAIVGFGFGTVFMTVQMFIVHQTTTDNRAEGMAIFLAAFYGGTLCGSAIGGMLADRFGFRSVFLLSAGMAICSSIFLFFILSATSTGLPSPADESNQAIPPQGPLRETSFFRNLTILFTDRNFSALVLFQSIPNKICLIGFIYYLAPLFFESMGSRQSDIGRYIMLYSLVMILFSQTASRWTDRFFCPKPVIFWGGFCSGLALLPCYFFQGTPAAAALGILLLGFAHAFSVSNQAKLASQLRAVRQIGLGPGLGIYRQTERIGNVLAPILSGALLSQFGYATALALIGAGTSISSILFAILFSDKKET